MVGTKEQYFKRMFKMKPNVYMDGKKVDRTDPRITSGLYVFGQTYDACNDPEYADVCVTNSHLNGEKISRYTHVNRSKEDLLAKQKMTKLVCHRVGGCQQRCMGIDAINALSVVTYELDQNLGTKYNENFNKFLKYMQDGDLTANCAQTDVKGDRLKRPSEQVDPDMYLRVVETREDGIIVRGAKCCNSAAPYVDEIIALPTRFMGPDDYEYAVAFALPADWEGIRICSLPAQHHKRNHIDAPCAHVGDAESLTIFDDVFVPNDRIFMNGQADKRQTPYAGLLALMFAHFHRHSYTGCKPAVSEVIASEAALIAEYNGIEKASHVKDKLCHIISIAELVFAAGEASAYRAVPTDSGTWLPDEILTNAGRKLAGEEIFNEYKILADLAGGLIATLPMEGDFYNEEVGELLHKYVARNPKISTENIHRAFRMIENQMVSSFGAAQMVAGLHGGGSPQMETIAMMSRYDLENLKRLAKYLGGIEEGVPRIERPTVTPMKMLEKFEKYTDKKG